MNSVPYIVPLLLIGEGNMTRSKQQHNVLSGIKHALSGSSSNSYAKLNDSETSPPQVSHNNSAKSCRGSRSSYRLLSEVNANLAAAQTSASKMRQYDNTFGPEAKGMQWEERIRISSRIASLALR